jgi:CBS domain-containing protein
MELSRIARRAVSIHPKATVYEAAQMMLSEGIGAMVVLDEGRLVGIISERDIVGRVVSKRRDPEATFVSEVMTADVQTITEDQSIESALEIMHRLKFRHLPLVDRSGKVIGVVSMRAALRDRVGELSQKNADLWSFISTDGPGG